MRDRGGDHTCCEAARQRKAAACGKPRLIQGACSVIHDAGGDYTERRGRLMQALQRKALPACGKPRCMKADTGP